MESNHCTGNDIVITNTSTLGIFGGAAADCIQNARFFWSVNVNDTGWNQIAPGPGQEFYSDWLIGEDSSAFYLPDPSNGYIDLTIPAAFVEIPGC